MRACGQPACVCLCACVCVCEWVRARASASASVLCSPIAARAIFWRELRLVIVKVPCIHHNIYFSSELVRLIKWRLVNLLDYREVRGRREDRARPDAPPDYYMYFTRNILYYSIYLVSRSEEKNCWLNSLVIIPYNIHWLYTCRAFYFTPETHRLFDRTGRAAAVDDSVLSEPQGSDGPEPSTLRRVESYHVDKQAK